MVLVSPRYAPSPVTTNGGGVTNVSAFVARPTMSMGGCRRKVISAARPPSSVRSCTARRGWPATMAEIRIAPGITELNLN